MLEQYDNTVLDMLRTEWLRAHPRDKIKWMRALNQALDFRLTLMKNENTR